MSNRPPEPELSGRRIHSVPRARAWLSLANLPIKHRLPLLIGLLLLGIFVMSALASYREVRESSLEIGRERLRNLTQQFANISQQSSFSSLNKLVTAANDPVISAFLQSPSPVTKDRAVALLQQFGPGQDPGNLQIQLWNSDRALVLTIPESSLPGLPSLAVEFNQCSKDPYKALGALRIVDDAVVVPSAVAVRDPFGTLNGYLVKWRKVSVNPPPQQLTDLLGNQAVLYFGNTEGNVWTDLTRVVHQPPVSLEPNPEVVHYVRDGHSVMALGQVIGGTPWSVVIEISDQAFVSHTRRFLRRMTIFGMSLLALGLAAAVALSRNITQPLRALTDAASAIRGGDYSRTVDIHQDDELGALASAFNSMVISTRDSQRELERKVQEQTLQLEAAPWAMLMVNQDGRVTLVNAQAEKLFGYDRSELLDQPIEMLVPERYRSAHPAHRRLFSQHPTARAMGAGRDLYGLRKDGEEIPIEIGLNPITTEQGDFVLASIIDITARKRAEERFRLVVEASPSAMLMVNDQGRMTLVNNQTEHLFGYKRAELLGQPIEMLVPERYRTAHPGQRSGFFRAPSTRAMGAGRDLYGLRKDRREIPIEIGLNPINTDEGSFVLASIIDITERKRTEQVLRESEERLHTIIENLSEGLVISDLSGQLIHWNKPGLAMHGFSSMEEGLRKLPDFQELFELSTLDGTVLKLEEWPLARVIAGDKFAEYDVRLRRTDTDWQRIFSFGGAIVKEPNGRPLAFVNITDITKRKQVEEELRRSQQQLAGVIGSAMDAIIAIDDQQRIVLFNDAAEKMFFFPSEDAIGQPLDRFIPERFRSAHKGHVQNFGQTHVTRRSVRTLGDLFGLRADGEEFPIEASISQVESEGRKFYTVILRDITERKRSEEALKEQTRILDFAPVMIRDLKGQIILWNSGVEKIYGWKTEEAVGRISYDLLQTKFPRPLEEIQARLYAHGRWEGETVHTRKDGKEVVIASQWVLHRDQQDKPKAVLVVNNDITERKHAEREILRLNEELEQRVADRTAQLEAVNKELEAFSYSVSHDLRAPLRHIDGFSQALLEDYSDKLDNGAKSYLQEVRSASQEMAQLIDDMLQLARVTRTEMRREEVNLSELATSVIADLRKTDGRPGVTVNIEEGVSRQGDKRLLRIVLMNLLGNSWKFTAKRKQASITFGEAGKSGESHCFVRDNGAGFDMTYGNKLFGAFQRLHNTGEFEGTGIGLATVQRIINRHGGRVWAEGAVNEGAAFYFVLPNFKETGNGKQSDLAG